MSNCTPKRIRECFRLASTRFTYESKYLIYDSKQTNQILSFMYHCANGPYYMTAFLSELY